MNQGVRVQLDSEEVGRVHASESRRCLPLTSAQHAIWLGHQVDASGTTYNVANYVDIEDAVDVALMSKAISIAVEECEILRTRFEELEVDGEARVLQRIEPLEGMRLPVVDLSRENDPEASARRRMTEASSTPIDLENGPIWSTTLYRIDGGRYFWYFKTHHIAFDGFAFSMLFRRVAELYSLLVRGTRVTPNPFASLGALVESEAAYEASPAYGADREYWLGRCTPASEVPSFVADVAVQPASAIHWEETLGACLVEGVEALAQSLGVHWVQVVVGAFAAYLSRATGARRVVIGVPLLNRLGSVAARVPSTMANVLPLPLEVSPFDTVSDIVRRASEGLSDMRRHQRYRAETVRRDCHLLGDGRRLTGPQINIDMFSEPLSFAGARGMAQVVSAGPADDLSFLIRRSDGPSSLRLVAMGHSGLYDSEELRLISLRFLEFLTRFTAASEAPIARLDAYLAAELKFFFDGQNETMAVLREDDTTETLLSIFEQNTTLQSDSVALTLGDEKVSYVELNDRAARLARQMIANGLPGGNPLVALLLPRSIETIVSIIGVFKAGGAYVPLDPDAPVERTVAILDDTAPAMIVTDSANVAKVKGLRYPVMVIDEAATKLGVGVRDEADPSRSIGRSPKPEDLAYIIYTSGSTGKPKGVKITHRNVVRLFRSTNSWFGYRATDVWTLCHAYTFDASVWEIWGALLHGSRLVIVPVETARSPEELLELVVRERVTIFGQIPSAFYRFMEAERDRPDLGRQLRLRYQCFGAEALDLGRLRPWLERHRVGEPPLLNMYGITETTINATYHFVSEPEIASGCGSMIGKAYSDLRIMVLDDALRPVPVGGYGEMYVSGAGLAQGYMNRPELDAVRFVADPYGPPGTRMYRSGDVAVIHSDGNLEYIGRADQQVKINGYRIELGEVESHLRSHPAVSDAAATIREDATGDRKLVSFVVLRRELREGANFDVSVLREYLRERVPAYMVPNVIGVLDSLPFTRNGKVDRRALPAIRVSSEHATAPPRHELDRHVLAVWQTFLQVDGLGIDSNFFDVGGDSIKAIRVCRDLDIPVTTLFERPTPRACSDCIGSRGAIDSRTQKMLHHFPVRSIGPNLTLILVPYAGGTPFVYRELVEHLSTAIACCAVVLPGHDPTRPDDALMSLNDVVSKTVDEVLSDVKGPVAVYGHCAGNALAIALTGALERADVTVEALFIGGMLPDQHPEAVLSTVSAQSGEELVAFLRGLGGFRDIIDAESLANICRTTKHDSIQTAAFFADFERSGGTLRCPIRVVVGSVDPLTAGYESRYLDWRRSSSNVTLAVVEGGGHYFVTEKAPELAEILNLGLSDYVQQPTKGAPRTLRAFHNPFEDEDGQFYVLENALSHLSLWPTFAEIPKGWHRVSGPGRLGALTATLAEKRPARGVPEEGRQA